MRIPVYLLFATILLAAATWWWRSERPSADPVRMESLASEGELLAQQHCVKCHLFPEPELLDQKTWTMSTLPSMGNYFGIFSHKGHFGEYRITREQELVENPETRLRILMADTAQIEPDAWEKIMCYYGQRAPEALVTGVLAKVSNEQANFRARGLKHPSLSGQRPLTSCVSFLPKHGAIAFASLDSPDVRFADRNLNLSATKDARGTAVDVQADSDGTLVITVIGSIKPSEMRTGLLLKLAPGASTPVLIADKLHRPVSGVPFDANGDGASDFLVCEYGHHTGALTWLEWQVGGDYQKHTILDKANPVAAIPQDADADGDLDIYALFAGGREGIWRFINDGKGNFEGEELIEFPAPTGSVDLELVDIDLDGDQDLLHVAGDNDDSSPILKPYHGLRIFLNDGKGGFSLAHFHPMHGAYAVEAADFDLDGDIDIALCAQFGDYANHPEQAFVLLENSGQLEFTVKSHAATHGVRWARMDAADFDADGDADIVLGAMIPRGKDWLKPDGEILKMWQNAPEILLLENLSR